MLTYAERERLRFHVEIAEGYLQSLRKLLGPERDADIEREILSVEQDLWRCRALLRGRTAWPRGEKGS